MTEMKAKNQYQVYVIELEESVRGEKRFRNQNPYYVDGSLCVYVGSTVRTPEERLQQHFTDRIKGSRWVRKYGKVLLNHAYEDVPLFQTREEAEKEEVFHAQKLQSKGWGVWQN